MSLAALVASLAAALASAGELRSDATRPLCAVYRFDAAVGPLKGLPPQAVAERLGEWGIAAVFGRPDKPLRAALRARGIRVFASLGCFQGERHWKRRPESRPLTAAGRPLPKRKWYAGVCPSQEPVVRELEAEAARLAGRYDGVWLDFLRYPGYWEEPGAKIEETCFCPACLERFAEFAGIATATELKPSSILGERREVWVRFKVATIRAAAERISRAVKRANPGALVGLFSVPWPRDDRRSTFGQDLAELAPSLDAVSPMAYAGMLGRPADWIAEQVGQARSESGRPAWPAVSLPEAREPKLADSLAQALASPSEGVIVLSWPLGRHADEVAQACRGR